MAELPRLQSIPGGCEDRTYPAQTAGEPLWREVLGQRLRVLRQEQRSTLVETAGRAGVSPQYLSEVERGLKEPSSEMIAALAGALDTTLGNLTMQVSHELHRHSSTVLTGTPSPRRGGTPRLIMMAA